MKKNAQRRLTKAQKVAQEAKNSIPPRDHLSPVWIGSKQKTVGAFVVVCACFIVFGQVLGFDFLAWDDGINIYQNAHFGEISLKTIGYFWQHQFLGMFIPLTYSVWGMLIKISVGMNEASVRSIDPAIFHGVNLLFHIGNALLVLRFLRRFELPAFASVVGALVFALHPLQVETVAWVTELKGLMSTFFSLLALDFFMKAASLDEEGGASNAENRRYATLAWAVLCLVLGLVSKPAAVVLPLLALAVTMFFRGKARAYYCLGVLFIVVLPFAWLTTRAQPADLLIYVPSLWGRVLVALDAVAFHMGHAVFPISPHFQAMDYGRTPKYVLESGVAYWTWLLPVGLVAGIAGITRRAGEERIRWVWLAAALFLIPLIPVSGIVPFAFQNFSTTADRYSYFALMGFALAVAHLVSYVSTSTKWRSIVMLVVLVMAARTYVYAGVFKNNEELFGHSFRVNPSSALASNGLGQVYTSQGRLSEALKQYEHTLEVDSENAGTFNSIGILYSKRQQYDQAISNFLLAIKYDSKNASYINNLGLAQFESGRLNESIDSFFKAVALTPCYSEPFVNIGAYLIKTGTKASAYVNRYEEALRYREVTEECGPPDANTWWSLGFMASQKGDHKKAVVNFTRAIDSGMAPFKGYSSRGVAYLGLKEYRAALADFERALGFEKQDANAYFNIGYTYQLLGEQAKAAENYRNTLKIDGNHEAALQNLRGLGM